MNVLNVRFAGYTSCPYVPCNHSGEKIVAQVHLSGVGTVSINRTGVMRVFCRQSCLQSHSNIDRVIPNTNKHKEIGKCSKANGNAVQGFFFCTNF